MKKKQLKIVLPVMAATLFASTVISSPQYVFASENVHNSQKISVQENSPYLIVTDFDEALAISQLRDGRIVLTNQEIPDIIDGTMDGIVITDQPLDEALVELEKAFEQSGTPIKNLYTVNFKMSEPAGINFDEIEVLSDSRGTSAPNSPMPGWNYSSDWSGTVNYTYTNYYVPSYGWISTGADTNHYVTYYSTSGSNLGTRNATLSGGRYSTSFQNANQFYGAIYHNASGSSQRATYSLDAN